MFSKVVGNRKSPVFELSATSLKRDLFNFGKISPEFSNANAAPLKLQPAPESSKKSGSTIAPGGAERGLEMSAETNYGHVLNVLSECEDELALHLVPVPDGVQVRTRLYGCELHPGAHQTEANTLRYTLIRPSEDADPRTLILEYTAAHGGVERDETVYYSSQAAVSEVYLQLTSWVRGVLKYHLPEDVKDLVRVHYDHDHLDWYAEWVGALVGRSRRVLFSPGDNSEGNIEGDLLAWCERVAAEAAAPICQANWSLDQFRDQAMRRTSMYLGAVDCVARAHLAIDEVWGVANSSDFLVDILVDPSVNGSTDGVNLSGVNDLYRLADAVERVGRYEEFHRRLILIAMTLASKANLSYGEAASNYCGTLRALVERWIYTLIRGGIVHFDADMRIRPGSSVGLPTGRVAPTPLTYTRDQNGRTLLAISDHLTSMGAWITIPEEDL